MQFIEAIEMRDERKLKHQGFFVNIGSVERVGEKVEVIAHARRKQRNTAGQATKGKASAGAKAKAQVRDSASALSATCYWTCQLIYVRARQASVYSSNLITMQRAL